LRSEIRFTSQPATPRRYPTLSLWTNAIRAPISLPDGTTPHSRIRGLSDVAAATRPLDRVDRLGLTQRPDATIQPFASPIGIDIHRILADRRHVSERLSARAAQRPRSTASYRADIRLCRTARGRGAHATLSARLRLRPWPRATRGKVLPDTG